MRTVDKDLIDFATLCHLAELLESTKHGQAVDVVGHRSIIDDADKPDMIEIQRIHKLLGQRNRLRVGTVKGDALLDMSTTGKRSDSANQDRSRCPQADDEGDKEK